MAGGRGASLCQCHVPAAARPQTPARVRPPLPRPMGMWLARLSHGGRRHRQPSPADESETRARAMALYSAGAVKRARSGASRVGRGGAALYKGRTYTGTVLTLLL